MTTVEISVLKAITLVDERSPRDSAMQDGKIRGTWNELKFFVFPASAMFEGP